MAQTGSKIFVVVYLRQNKSPKSSELLGLLNFEVFYPLQDLRTTLPDPKPSQSYHSGLVCEYLTWGINARFSHYASNACDIRDLQYWLSSSALDVLRHDLDGPRFQRSATTSNF